MLNFELFGGRRCSTPLMFLNLGQRTQAQVWLDVQFSDFHMLAGMYVYFSEFHFSSTIVFYMFILYCIMHGKVKAMVCTTCTKCMLSKLCCLLCFVMFRTGKNVCLFVVLFFS